MRQQILPKPGETQWGSVRPVIFARDRAVIVMVETARSQEGNRIEFFKVSPTVIIWRDRGRFRGNSYVR